MAMLVNKVCFMRMNEQLDKKEATFGSCMDEDEKHLPQM